MRHASRADVTETLHSLGISCHLSVVTHSTVVAGILLRNPEQPGPRVPAGEGGVRRRHRRAGHAVGGELQGLHAHHAAAARQPHAVDVGHAGRRRAGRARAQGARRARRRRGRRVVMRPPAPPTRRRTNTAPFTCEYCDRDFLYILIYFIISHVSRYI